MSRKYLATSAVTSLTNLLTSNDVSKVFTEAAAAPISDNPRMTPLVTNLVKVPDLTEPSLCWGLTSPPLAALQSADQEHGHLPHVPDQPIINKRILKS